jgi:hypothetical protein
VPHPWPIEPFDEQHPVRGVFGDPRIGARGGSSFHFGVDVAALDGTAVHAVAPGRVSVHGQNIAVVEGVLEHAYWHVVPNVRHGERVQRGTLLGHIADGWGHVHFAERRGAAYWNPLRPGALTPYKDFGAPVVTRIETLRAPASALNGLVDLVVETFDHPPLSAPQPAWHGLPVTPALVRWRLVRYARAVVPWRIALDFRTSFVPKIAGNPPSDERFHSVYAPGTRQNHPHKPGSYRIWLACDLDTRRFPDGHYRLDVEAADSRGNATRGHLAVTIANAARDL